MESTAYFFLIYVKSILNCLFIEIKISSNKLYYHFINGLLIYFDHRNVTLLNRKNRFTNILCLLSIESNLE